LAMMPAEPVLARARAQGPEPALAWARALARTPIRPVRLA